jgi:predicted Zn finger-like uncharacterized protein
MNVTCSHCNTVFRVDPAKIPPEGLRARCSICRGIFEVPGVDGRAPSPAAEGASVVAPAEPAGVSVAAAPAPAPAPAASSAAAPSPSPVETPRPAPAPAAAPRPSPAPAPSTPVAATPTAAAPSAPAPSPPVPPSTSGTRPPPSFGSSDPNAKARRLARALVSDIVTYHPERRDKALADGTLRREFMEEIKKSWEEYVDQVGAEMARSTPHFRDALNDILARGQAVF